MFEGLLKSKFYSKCKSTIKLTKTRLEMIRKKRNAMQKYLKNDIADLIKDGLDINAYGRAEGLLVELNLSSCYNFVEQFCGYISNHISVMNKQRECPEECREAVSSLMFAAARFADLPELRELRSIFTERFGNSLECYVNQEFVEKLKSIPPTKDMKLQLMQDIALETGKEWDSKALEQKLYKPPASEQDWSKNDDKYKSHKSREHNNVKEYNAPRRSKEDLSSHGRKEVNNDGYKLHNRRENAVPNQGRLSHERPENTPSMDQNGQQNHFNSVNNVSREEVDDKMPFYHRLIPPPYIKPKVSKNETSLEVPPTDSGREGTGHAKLNGHVDGEVEDNHDQDNSVGETKPKPRSVRRRCLKPPPGHDNTGSVEGDDAVKMNSNGKKQVDAKQGLKVCNQKDEEERVIDGLLMHYSTKQSPYEKGKVEAALKLPPSRQTAVDTSKATREKSKDGRPARATSFPLEPTSPIETTKGPARASSFQPDTLNPAAAHVHPKLLDYDDFVARLAAFRGK
uniref:Putative Regulator of Vps4 activity in the MVB pathway protein n=1 Tax=Davidia involucrata TaxID=16924 RepID=A0A5B7ARF7_DAVIN